MTGQRLDEYAIEVLLEQWPREHYELVHELRALVLEAVPEVEETVAFSSLCYALPGAAYGRIGGHVCSIGPKDDALHLGFIHGATLPDPQGLLTGRGKAKRHVELRTLRDIRRRPIRRLVRAAARLAPGRRR